MNNIEKLAIEQQPQIKPLWLVIDEHGYPIHCSSYKEACNEHINDAINDFDLTDAKYWKVVEAVPKALQSSEPVATAVYEIYAGLDNWREVSKAEYDDYKRTKRMLVTANANDFCYAELQTVYDEMYVHKDVARVANQLYKLIHSRTLPPSTVTLEEHNKRIAELEAVIKDDAFAMTFQSIAQYRNALLKILRGEQNV